MGIKLYKPTTPSRRGMSGDDFSSITTDKPEKSLVCGKKRTNGRNNLGRITVRHKGGGHNFRKNIDAYSFKINKSRYFLVSPTFMPHCNSTKIISAISPFFATN